MRKQLKRIEQAIHKICEQNTDSGHDVKAFKLCKVFMFCNYNFVFYFL